jgi:hypothetical protein
MGVILLTPHGEHIKYMVHLEFKATNNMVVPRERRLPAHCQTSQRRLFLQ